jgi:hypothetical protein
MARQIAKFDADEAENYASLDAESLLIQLLD